MTNPALDRRGPDRAAAWSDYVAGRLEVQSRPFKASIEITRNCNYRCVMCPQSWDARYRDYHPEYNMSPALFRRVAEQLFPRLDYIHLQGYGETVISPFWPEILESCAPYAEGRRFGLVTNLSRRQDALWRRMMALGFVVIVSYDGASKETFEAIRRGGRFEDVEHNLRLLKEARAAGEPGRVALLVTLQKLNVHELPEFVDAAARHGAGTVTFASVIDGPHSVGDAAKAALKRLRGAARWTELPTLRELLLERARLWLRHGNPKLSLYDLPPERLLALKREAERRAASAGIELRWNDAFLAGLGSREGEPPIPPPPALDSLDPLAGIALSGQVARFQRCFKPYSYVVVNYRGDVGLCNHLITDSGWKQMGSLAEQSFDEIWNSSPYREQRRLLLEASPDNPSCAWCFRHRMTD